MYTRVVEVFPNGKVSDGSLLPMDHIATRQGEWAGPIPEPAELAREMGFTKVRVGE